MPEQTPTASKPAKGQSPKTHDRRATRPGEGDEMATATKKSTTAESWFAWLDELDALHRERAEVAGVGDAREDLEKARHRIRFLCGKAWESADTPANLDGSAMRGDADALNVRAVVRGEEEGDHAAAARALLALLSHARKTVDYRAQSADRRAFIESLAQDLGEARAQLETAADTLADLEARRDEIDTRTKAHEAKAPKVSESALVSLRKERDSATTERERLEARLAELEGDGAALDVAGSAEREARARLDEAEALLALGEGGEAEAKAARGAAEEARQALEEAKEGHRRQEAARRGLARKAEEAQARADTLTRVYRRALGMLRLGELATAEAQLVESVRGLSEHLATLARIHADLEEAEPGTSYGPARLEVKLPHLYRAPEGEGLHDRITITPHGVGQ